MRIGELIAIGRECKGWTLRDLERETGISNAVISQIETCKVKDPGFSTVVRLVEALGISMERAAATASLKALKSALRTTVIGKVTGEPREGDQVPGMPHAICHACGLGYRCADPDCPNEKLNPAMPWQGEAQLQSP
jgi:transcriptional regulator with XRE-family HTH domain